MAPLARLAAVLITSTAWFDGSHWEPNTTAPAGPGFYVGYAPTSAPQTVSPSIPTLLSSITAAAHTTATAVATTQPAPSPSSPEEATPSASSCGQGYVPCSNPGGFVCADSVNHKFGICGIDYCALVQDLAYGSTCADWMIQPAASSPGIRSISPSHTVGHPLEPSRSSSVSASFGHPLEPTSTTTASAGSNPNPGANIPDTSGSSTRYVTYTGSGGLFPRVSDWVSSFDELWAQNLKLIGSVCYSYGANSDAESAALKSAIKTAAQSSGLDARFVLAIVMQESRGCVRVMTTFGSHANPGLLQDNQGSATCNPASGTGPVIPCPSAEITQMIEDGVFGDRKPGEAKGDGLLQAFDEAEAYSPSSLAVKYYIAARIYNSGFYLGANLACGSATHCYVSDVANRLMGWTGDVSPCQNDVIASGCSSAWR